MLELIAGWNWLPGKHKTSVFWAVPNWGAFIHDFDRTRLQSNSFTYLQIGLKTRIDASLSATVGCIAGDIEEFAFLLAFRAYLRRPGSGDQKPALATFPVRQPTLWAYISFESPLTSIPAVTTSHLLVLFHVLIPFRLTIQKIRMKTAPTKLLHL